MNILNNNIYKNKSNYVIPFLWLKGETEEVIREEIKKIYECGIKEICIESRPHPDFVGNGWWHDVDIIMEEAKDKAMRVWVLDDAHFPTGYANGLIKNKYQERRKKYINYNTIDVWGSRSDVTLNIKTMLKPKMSFLDIGKVKDFEEQGKNKLISVSAYRLIKDNLISENEIIDLTDKVIDGFLKYRFPNGNWRIVVTYETKTDGGREDYINIIDRESVSTLIEAVYEPHFQRYKDEFGKTFAGFFSDEPGFGNTIGFDMDERIGHKNMPLPWSDELEEILKFKFKNEFKKLLPFLWIDSIEEEKSIKSRYIYMDEVTKLYSKNFSGQLGRWCEERGIEYIGHVIEDNNQHSRLGCGAGHYFRAMQGQHMAGIDDIGQQIIFSGAGLERVGLVNGDGEFYHYALAKLGASSGHLQSNKKGRTMCELFGAYGWSLGVRDMKWILDHLLVRGVNYLVPHAFSMSEYPDIDCPPHFYARGNNPQFKHFGYLMKYANRMCNILNGGNHVPSVAILYHAESEWCGEYMKMQKPARKLLENQIDFDFVSLDMLNDIKKIDGNLQREKFIINNVEFKALIIPYSRFITKDLIEFIKNSSNIPVIFIDKKPEKVIDSIELECDEDINKVLDKCIVSSLDEIHDLIRKLNLHDVELKKTFNELSYYHYKKENHIYMFNNESAYETFRGKVKIDIKNNALIYDGLSDTYKNINIERVEDESFIEIELKPYQSCLIIDTEKNVNDYYMPMQYKIEKCNSEINISNKWDCSLIKSKEYPMASEVIVMEKLEPISNIKPKFSGIIKYEKNVLVEDDIKNAYLDIEFVYEAIELWINDKYVGRKICEPYVFELEKYIEKGNNKITIEVATTLHRDMLNYEECPFEANEPFDPTGMFGKVIIKYN